MNPVRDAMPAHDAPADATGTPPRATRLAYLLSRYPAISHTFFLHEVLGLRALGMQIETASINAPDRAMNALPPVEAEEASKTFYVKSGGKVGSLLKLLGISVKHPTAFMRGLRAIFSVKGLTAKKRAMWFAYLAEALLLGDWMRQRDLPHLHVHFGGPVASVGFLTSRAWGVPFSLTIHGPEELQDFSANQMQEKLLQAAFVLCISSFAKSQLMQRLPTDHWSKLHVVRLGVPEEMLALPPVKAQSTALPHVVCVGRLVPEKGQRLLLQAIARLRAEGVYVTATLVGGGPERASLEKFVRQQGLSESVRLSGPQSHPETLALLRTADIFALPSFAEGIPVALMEAMALEIPCLSTTVAGISELIRSGQDGVLVAPSDVDALTESLRLLASDASLRARMGHSSRERVLEHYRLRDNHARLAEIFRHSLQPAVKQ
ncbi:glycosyltransferase family 4 protein [Granulicella cerasi]|uniref:Glycosyltransferase family 4 protein n=1 Tax=Granulicella cerasi TaxID=741063 RepID=A0ABW1ZB21_9BACT|nr:glycosyltransferase family 4 protein [Granulicella cerasi]